VGGAYFTHLINHSLIGDLADVGQFAALQPRRPRRNVAVEPVDGGGIVSLGSQGVQRFLQTVGIAVAR
jgi:hypothetical protein